MSFNYTAVQSKTVKDYYYVIEIEKDEWGTTKHSITRPLTKKEMRELSNSILNTINAEVG